MNFIPLIFNPNYYVKASQQDTANILIGQLYPERSTRISYMVITNSSSP